MYWHMNGHLDFVKAHHILDVLIRSHFGTHISHCTVYGLNILQLDIPHIATQKNLMILYLILLDGQL